MRSVRLQRINEQVKKELSEMLQFEVKDPRVGFVTITGVSVTPDLQQATVHISVMGTPEEKEEALLGLEKAKGFLRSQLGRRVKLRHTPELVFKLDQSLEYSGRINELLNQLQKGNETHEP